MSDAVSANVRAEDAHDGFGVANVPSNQSLVPSSSVKHILVFRVSVELGAVHSICVAIMGSVGFFQLHNFLSFDLVVHSDNGFTARSY